MKTPLILKPREKSEYNFYEDGVTQSMLQTWKACRQLASYQLDGWQAVSSPRMAAEFGTLVHRALELVYGGFIESIGKFCNQYRGEQLSLGMLSEEGVDYNAFVCEALVEAYIDYWSGVDAGFDWIAQEKTFCAPWGKRSEIVDQSSAIRTAPLTYLRGKIDGVLRRGKTDRTWLFETKTKGQINPESISQGLSFDFQNLFYVAAYEEITGEKVFGTIYNILRPPQLRQKANESPREFITRIRDDIVKRPEHYFFRMEVAYSPAQKERFRNHLNRQLRDFESWWKNREFRTYRNEGNCHFHWPCEYLPICATGKYGGFARNKKLFSELDEK